MMVRINYAVLHVSNTLLSLQGVHTVLLQILNLCPDERFLENNQLVIDVITQVEHSRHLNEILERKLYSPCYAMRLVIRYSKIF